ncbi:MAG: segregation/condensation protein A [Coriobacteriales bacterium]|jgi:segregation and condensation protein A|nr:segregation/condensation protein A [Coriobacteriales bacterium]
MSYRVRIESFEGPFDLLLSLVSEQKLDIGAIPISEVADQYLSYVDAMNELDMDVASDFLVVAATLLALKAASLLPEEAVNLDDDLDDLSPTEARNILIARLIAYKQFKNAAAALNARLESEGRMYARQAGLESPFVGLLPDYLKGVTLHNLAVICADLAARREVFLLEAEHIAAKPLPVESRIDAILKRLERKKKLTFSKLLSGETDATVIVVNFLALLELYHRGIVDLEQEQQYGEIAIQYRDPSQWTPGVDTGPSDVLEEFIQSLEQDGETDA